MAGTNQLSAYSAALNSSASGEATQLRNQSFRLGAKLLVWEPHKLLHNSWRPDVLRNVIVSGYVTIYQINKFVVNILYNMFIIGNMACGPHLARGP